MAYPPFVPRLWVYPGGNPASSPSVWGLPVDASAYIRQPGADGGQAITWTGGRQDEAAQVDAGTLSLSLDNRDGRWASHNALGPYAGLLDTNTPYRFGVQTGKDDFTRVVGAGLGVADSGTLWAAVSTWSATGTSAAWTGAVNTSSRAILGDSGAGDFDSQVTTWSSQVATGAAQLGGLVQAVDNSNYVMFLVTFSPAGVMGCRIQRTGGAGNLIVAVNDPLAGYTYTAGQRYRVRAQRDGTEVRMKVWPEANAEPTAWSAVGTESSLVAGDLGMVAWCTTGSTAVGIFTGFDAFECTAIEQSGGVVQWPVRWDKKGDNSWAPIQGAGILRRLQQGKGPRKSPLARQLPSANPTGYWPLEDMSGSTSFAPTVLGTVPGTFQNVSLSADSTLPGATVSPVFASDTGFVKVSSTKNHTVDGFAVMYFTKLASLPSAKTAVATIATTGRVSRWVLSLDASFNSYVEGFDTDDVLVTSAINALSTILDPLNWIAWQLELNIVGANTNFSFVLHQVGAATYTAQTGSYASTLVSQARSLVMGSRLLSGMAVAHLWMGPNTLPFVTDTFSLVSDGYRGELASDRIKRVCGEENIPVTIEAGTSDACGPQQETSALEALRAAEAADLGILYERGVGLGYRPRSVRYRQGVQFALTVSAGQIDDPPEPIMDDQRRANSVTAARVGGSSATVTDQTSVDRIGYYPGPSVNINVQSDDVLPWHAGWRVYLGTRRDLRWPGLSLEFARNPGLLPAWRKRPYGPRMTVVTGRPQVLGSDPDVIVEGFSCTLGYATWKVSLAASSAQGWDVYTLGDDLERLDADNSKLDVAVTTTSATSIQVDNQGDPGNTWAPTSLLPAEATVGTPIYIRVDQEVMGVTAVSDLFSTTKQTLTVIRNVNGAAALHAVGVRVSLAYPMIIAL